MTENDEESKGPLAERIAAHMKRVHGLLRNVNPYRGSTGEARAEMLRPEKRIDGTLRSQLNGTPGPGDEELDGPRRSSRAGDFVSELGRPLAVALVVQCALPGASE